MGPPYHQWGLLRIPQRAHKKAIDKCRRCARIESLWSGSTDWSEDRTVGFALACL